MNKTIFSFLFLLMILTSCNGGFTKSGSVYIKEFQYKGHDMVEVKEGDMYGYTVMHSPECRKCQQIYE